MKLSIGGCAGTARDSQTNSVYNDGGYDGCLRDFEQLIPARQIELPSPPRLVISLVETFPTNSLKHRNAFRKFAYLQRCFPD